MGRRNGAYREDCLIYGPLFVLKYQFLGYNMFPFNNWMYVYIRIRIPYFCIIVNIVLVYQYLLVHCTACHMNKYFQNVLIFYMPFPTLLQWLSNIICHRKVNDLCFIYFFHDLNEWMQPLLSLRRCNFNTWSSSLFLSGPWVLYLDSLILPRHFFLILQQYLSLFVNLIALHFDKLTRTAF